jgi:hypothetical protein
MESGLVATALVLSVTWTVKGKVPVTVGVPLITPVADVRLRPLGRFPADTLQVYGATPPETINWVEEG